VKVEAKAPAVVSLPPSVIVFPAFATPVPPLTPARVPPSTMSPDVAVAGVKPVVPALNVATPLELVKQVGQAMLLLVLRVIGAVAVCGWLYANAGAVQDATASKNPRIIFFILRSHN